MPPLVMALVFSVLPRRSPALLRPLVKRIAGAAEQGFIGPQLKLHMDWWERELAGSGWFAGGEFSAADIMMSFPVETAAVRAGGAGRPALKGFLERIHARPAYRKALERGGPYAYA